MSTPMPFTSAVAAAILLGSLAVLLVRPSRVPDWAGAFGGGMLLVVLGVLPLQEALGQLAASWNVFLFFLGLGLSAATADRAGVFRVAAEVAARLGRGSQTRLLINLYAAGVLVTAVLSNDATALLLTPVAFAIATRLGLDPRPYAFACALVANAASFILPVSNPANLLVLSRAPLSLGEFLVHLLLPSLVAISLLLVGLLRIFRAELAAPFAMPSAPWQPLERRTIVALAGSAALAVLYLVASALTWPLGLVATCGALFLVTLDGFAAGWQPRALLREVPWTLFPLLAGLLLLVDAAERIGFVAPLVHMIDGFARLGSAGLPAAVLGMAVLANVLNNLPAALVAASALDGLAPSIERRDLAAAVIVGVNLGPNLTATGSLATMLWLMLMRRRGVEVSALAFFRVGALATVPALLACAAVVWIAARFTGGV
jgi:arsenical pump membrane protein